MRPLWPTLILAGLVGCAVGPNFKTPAAPEVSGYLPPDGTAELTTAQTAAPLGSTDQAATRHDGTLSVQRLVAEMDIPAQWWSLFHSPQLDDLVQESLRASPTVQGAQALLRQANENAAAQKGSYFPAVQAGYAFSRQRDATGTLAPTLNSGAPIYALHTAQVTVSYVLDVFGANRRQVESLQALAESQRYQLEATYLTLASNVVTGAIEEASLRAQIAAVEKVVRAEREAAQILRRQNELGSIAQTDVTAQDAVVANTQALLPPLRKQLAQQRDLLAALAGRFPSAPPSQTFELSDLVLPASVPLTIPAALVRQRPDILWAEAQLHAATAAVGVATANLFPQLMLSGTKGGTSTALGQLFASGNMFWSAGASLSQTLFAGGSPIHRKRAAEAALDQAGAQYRAVVLGAFQNVADTLTALQLDADALDSASTAETSASAVLAATMRNLQGGSVSYLTLLNAEEAQSQAAVAVVQAQANQFMDTAALIQALGGGWRSAN